MAESTDVHRAEHLFREFFDHAPIGTAVTEPDGSWRRANPALATMLGYSVEELLATSFLALTHPDDIPQAREAVQSLLAGEVESCSLEKRLRAKSGEYVWVQITTRIQHDPNGGRAQFLTYVQDISKGKAADVGLIASEERYRRLFESAKDGILILDAVSGSVVDANPFMALLTGYSRDYFLGLHLWELGLFSDVAASKLSFAELQDTLYVRYDDLPLRTRDGKTVNVEFVSNVYVAGGKKVIQCNIRDITARRHAEQELRLRERALEAVSQGIVITDANAPDDPIIYASPAFMRLSGYEADEVLGRNCRFLQGAGTDPAARSLLKDAIRSQRATSVELLNFRKDGTPFWNSISISPIKDADGRVTHFVGVQTDVTARRQLESQFLQAQKMEAVGRLAGGIAHDFNNLLTVIISYAELIIADLNASDPVRADVEEIRTAGVRATALTRQLLAFSRQQVLEPKILNLNQSLAGIEKMLGRLLGADIEMTLLPEIGLGNVKADPGQVEQVIMNLAINARDAMPQGGRLTIETANLELDHDYALAHHDVRAGSYVLMAVSDTGVGMDKPTLARIFEPFFTTKEQGRGTGLGLATVFGIVKQSEGHIFAYSEPGKGTTFKVYFPRIGGVAAPPPDVSSPSDSEHGVGTILLVEDESQVRTLTQSILRRDGYVVLAAANGGEALLICEQHAGNIDLLLTDVVMPRMSGRQLAERLAPMRPAMKVLYMSGYTDDTILQHGLIDSGVAFLQKPLTPTSLTRKVREVLRSQVARART